MADSQRSTPMLDELEKGPWPSFVTQIEEMADEGRRHGLDVPFLRPSELASDTASGVDVWRHAWLESERHRGCRFDLSVLLQPTTPLRRADEVERTVRALVDGGHRAAATVGRVPLDFTPERCLRLGQTTACPSTTPRGRESPGARTSRLCTSATAAATR